MYVQRASPRAIRRLNANREPTGGSDSMTQLVLIVLAY